MNAVHYYYPGTFFYGMPRLGVDNPTTIRMHTDFNLCACRNGDNISEPYPCEFGGLHSCVLVFELGAQ